jgi:pimeloyl-ACP methyl ester carboxylesterase
VLKKTEKLPTMSQKLPLVLIPGLMCDDVVWRPLLDALSESSQPIMVNHAQASSLTHMAESILASAPPQFAMAGHSMGGRVALEIHRLAPKRVLGVSLMDTGYLPLPAGEAGDNEVSKRQALVTLAQKSGVRAMGQAWVQGMVAPHRLADTVLIEAILDMFETKSAAFFADQIQALIHRPDGTSVLRSMTCPVQLLCGELDSWSNVAQHEAMSALLPGRPAVDVIAGAGHMCTMEDPLGVAKAMLKWLHAVPS